MPQELIETATRPQDVHRPNECRCVVTVPYMQHESIRNGHYDALFRMPPLLALSGFFEWRSKGGLREPSLGKTFMSWQLA